MTDLHFRFATEADAAFVARHVLEALHWHMYELPLGEEQQRAWDELTAVCRHADVLYSYRHATIALVGDRPAGLILAYDGADYHDMRRRTFALLPAFSAMDVDAMEDEAARGDYYIDSLAVVPEFRGRGVGRALLERAVRRGRSLGLRPSLLVDPDNGGAQRLYAAAGFVRDDEVTAFGQVYWRMRR